jgi:hypothetical protein
MAFSPRHGSKARLLFNNRSLSTMMNDATMTYSADQAEVSVWQATDKDYIVGIRDCTFQGGGIFVGNPVATQDVIETALGASTDPLMTYGPEGDSVGSAASLIRGGVTMYEVKSPVSGAVSVSFSLQSNGRGAGGQWHAPLEARTSTGALTELNSGLASGSTLGGVGHLHITSASTLTTGITVVIQHSSDGGTPGVWADLITFETSTGDGQERVEVTGAVKQYTRANCTGMVGGASKSVTWAAAFARIRAQ